MGARGARPSWVGRHKAFVVLVSLVALLLGGVGGWAVYLNHQHAGIPRIHVHLAEQGRPAPAGGTGTGGSVVNILVAGADSGYGPGLARSVASRQWRPGSYRSDTIMVLHITADRRHAYLVSVPRDSWVDIPGYGRHKVNAAFSYGGPSLFVQTVEQLTGLRMDHLALVDWAGFRAITAAVGGVEVYIPHTFEDTTQQTVWTAGHHTLDGEQALRYVRTRHGLPGGDLDRIARQQNFLRSLLTKVRAEASLSNPRRLTGLLTAVTGNLVLDDGFSDGDIRSLALSLRHLGGSDITYVTLPVRSLGTVGGQSVVRLDRPRTRALFGAVLTDELPDYLTHHNADTLADTRSVS